MSTHSTSNLSPERALLHPAWLGALALLILNDHVLKGAELLPLWLTGKLSDVAGLLVAPMLFAAVGRARTPRAVALAHLAVGAVFAALQLSAPFAAVWGGLFETLGVGWVTWQDPTDLLALPALALSWALFVPVARRQVHHGHLMRSAQVGAGAVGVIFCMATSPPPCDEGDENCYYDDCGYDAMRNEDGVCMQYFDASVYVHNATDEQLEVVVRPLLVTLDCPTVQADPTAWLIDEAFGPGVTWTVPAHTSLPLTNSNWSCNAVVIEGESMPRALVFWDTQTWPSRRHFAEPVEIETTPGGIQIARNEHGNLALSQIGEGTSILHKLEQPAPATDAACIATPGAERIDWSPVELNGLNVAVSEISLGEDGCFGLTLDPGDHPSLPPKGRWYICVAPDLFPFEDGDILQISEGGLPGALGSVLSIQRTGTVDPDAPRPYLAMLAVRAGAGGTIDGDGLQLETAPIDGCGVSFDEACGAAGRNLGVTVRDPFSDDVLELVPGEAGEMTRYDGTRRDVRLITATWLAVAAPTCFGSERLGVTMDLVVLDRLERMP